MTFLSALELCKSRPKVVVVSAHILMASTTWLLHPEVGYEKVSEGLRHVIESGGKSRGRLEQPGEAEWAEFDPLPAPSLIGANRTMGDLELVLHAKASTREQRRLRLRDLMDYHTAERLESDGAGVLWLRDLGAMLTAMQLPSVAYISPVNHELAEELLGAGTREHIARNAGIVEEAYLAGAGDLGTVVNLILECSRDGFYDPLHLFLPGRQLIARAIAGAAAPILTRSKAV